MVWFCFFLKTIAKFTISLSERTDQMEKHKAIGNLKIYQEILAYDGPYDPGRNKRLRFYFPLCDQSQSLLLEHAL